MDKIVIRGLDAPEHQFEPNAQPVTAVATPSESPGLPSRSRRNNNQASTSLLAIGVAKDNDFAAWYQQVLLKGDMIDYYDVSGCYILKPYSWSIWESLREWFDKKIKVMGVRNCSFPMFVSEDVLQKEKDHIEGFAAEVAWVTESGKSKLEKKIAIRPTSETIMYPYFAKWIQSYRDLPLRLNQWNSVVRWEFKHPQPFLRSREFFWQEGHTAHLTREGADAEVTEILNLYAAIYEDLLAVPVVRGYKTEKEKFAGGLYTTTVEGYIPITGRGIQGATSHCLGQNFSKMFGITVEDPKTTGKRDVKSQDIFVWQNSWAFTTRVIGVMVMIHGDDKGLVMPPRVAPTQLVVVPVGLNVKTPEEVREKLLKDVAEMATELRAAGLRVELDDREEYSPGYKFNHWELRGVPIRLEIGPGEMDGGYVTMSRRVGGAKEKVERIDLRAKMNIVLEEIQQSLYDKARAKFSSHVKILKDWDSLVPALDAKNLCLVPFCLQESCEDTIKQLSSRAAEAPSVLQDAAAPSMGAKSLCIPFEQPSKVEGTGVACINPQCKENAVKWCLFGRSY